MYPVVLLAAQAAGFVISTANAAHTPDDLAHQLEDSGATTLIVHPSLIKVASKAMQSFCANLEVFVLPGEGDGRLPEGWHSFRHLPNQQQLEPIKIPSHELKDRVAYLPYSSGTTARSKGVEITHRNIVSVVSSCTRHPFK